MGSPSAARPQPEGQAAGTRPRASLRALIVEDSESDYELIKASLEQAGWTLEAMRAEDRASMRLALAMQRWDVVISDYRLPRFSGHEALELTRESGQELPFILVSGAIGEDAAVAALHAGAFDCINKSNLSRLAPAVERGLATCEAHRERQRAERELRQGLGRLASLVDASPLAIIALDLAGKVTIWNPAAERMFGWNAAQVLGKEPPSIGPEQMSEHRRIREQVLAGHTIQMEARRRKADGTLVDVSLSVAPMRDADGVTTGSIALFADIGERKRAEQELRASREQLRALGAHTRKAIEAERARIARELHDQVGGTLTALRSELEALSLRVGANEEVARRIGTMDRLLDTALQSSISISRNLRPNALDTGIVAALEWQAREFSERTGVACRIVSNDPEVRLEMEQSTALFRLFQEALTNIAKHARARRVDVELFASPTAVALEIRDDGVGVASADMAKSDSFGLRGMMERVSALGGWLDVSGQPGRGTTLMAYIPRREAPAAKDER